MADIQRLSIIVLGTPLPGLGISWSGQLEAGYSSRRCQTRLRDMGCTVRGYVRVHARAHCQNERNAVTPAGDIDHFGKDDLGGLFCLTGRKHSDEEDDTAGNTDQKECNLRLWQLPGEEHDDGGCERLVQNVHEIDLPLSRDKVLMPEAGDRSCDLGTDDRGAGREEAIGDDGEPAHDKGNARSSFLG